MHRKNKILTPDTLYSLGWQTDGKEVNYTVILNSQANVMIFKTPYNLPLHMRPNSNNKVVAIFTHALQLSDVILFIDLSVLCLLITN